MVRVSTARYITKPLEAVTLPTANKGVFSVREGEGRE